MKKESEIKVSIFFLFLAIIILLLSPSAHSENLALPFDQALKEGKLEKKVLEELKNNDNVAVIITLKDSSLPNNNQPRILSSETPLSKKAKFYQDQNEVLNKLNLKNKDKSQKTTKIQAEETYDFELKYQYSIINGLSGRITQEGIDKLIQNDLIKKIEFDRPIKIFLDQSVPLIKANSVWNVTVSRTPINGTGETVCVIDTGIDYTHPALGNCTGADFLSGNCSKVIGGYDIADDDNNPIDTNNHGTHVSGIIASTDSTYRGVAPGASLIAVKVFPGSSESTTSSNVIAGIDWCINNKTLYNISIITMSLGDGVDYTAYCDDDSLAAAANNAANEGIFVDIASGNNGYTDGVSSPACASNVTSVGGTTKSDAVDTSYSNTGPILSLLAPGTSITSSILNPAFGSMSGTSMAAPHVAGAAVLISQYWKLAYNTTPTPFQIRTKLKLTGQPINDTRNGLIFSRINILKAIQPFLNFTTNNPVNATTLTTTFAFINATSDVNLSTAQLEWNYNNGTSINYTMNNYTLANFYYNLTNLNSGTYTYRVYGNDSVNTWGVSEIRTLIIDQPFPNITIYYPENNSYHKQGFNLNISIANLFLSSSFYNITNSSGALISSNSNRSLNLASFNWTDLINISNSTFSDGNYTLTVFANSTAGNSTAISITFIIDKTNPSIFAINIAPETAYNNDTVILTANITDTNLNSSKLYLESNLSGTWTNYSLILETGNRYNFTINSQNLTNQKNIAYRFHASDLANNFNTSETYNFTVQNRAPTNLNILSPTNGTILELGNTYSFNASASDPDGDVLFYAWNFGDGTSYSLTQNTSHQFNSTGNFTIILNVSDSYSSFNLTDITLIVNDTQTPNLTSISYDSSVDLGSETNQTVNASVSDYSGIFNLTLYFNNLPQNRSCSFQTRTSWTCSWSWTGLSIGNHNFTLNLTDNFTIRHTLSPTYNFTVIGCGDGIKNSIEACDGGDLDGKTCISQGYASGTLACSNDCALDTNNCVSASSPPATPTNSGGGGGGGGSTSSTPLCTIGAINCQGSTAYKECLASGTQNIWSEIKEVPPQKECKSGSLVKIEEITQETTPPKEIISPKQEKVEETNQSLNLHSDLSAKNPEEKTSANTSKGTSLTGWAVGFIERVSFGGTLYILIALIVLLTIFYLLARKN